MSISNVMNQLTGVPVQNGINAADFIKTVSPTQAIGSLNTTQVKGLLAQAAATVNQGASVVSPINGVGKFGISPQQLENLGFIKPGTVSNYLSDPSKIASVLQSPAVWTGKDGVSNLTNFTSNIDTQARAMQGTLQQGFNSLSKLGTLNGVTNPADVGSLLQVSSKFGVNDAANFAKGVVPGELVNQINDVAKSAQFSVNFTDTKLPPTLKGEIIGQNFTDKINRNQIDTATKALLGNDKIPAPDYKIDSKDLVKQRNLAIAELEKAKANYEAVLKANGNNRSNPAVESAWAEFKSAQAKLNAL